MCSCAVTHYPCCSLNDPIFFRVEKLHQLIKAINKVQREEEEAPEAPPEPTAEEKLLTEIRDLLKAKA